MDGSGPSFAPATFLPTASGHIVELGKDGPNGQPGTRVWSLEDAERTFSALAFCYLSNLATGHDAGLTSLAAIVEMGAAVRVARQHTHQSKKADARPARTASAPVHQEETQ